MCQIIWDKYFSNITPKKSNKKKVTCYKVKSKISIAEQIEIIKRINSGEKLKIIASDYSLDPSSLSRVKSKKTWKFAHKQLETINAQRLSKAIESE